MPAFKLLHAKKTYFAFKFEFAIYIMTTFSTLARNTKFIQAV